MKKSIKAKEYILRGISIIGMILIVSGCSNKNVDTSSVDMAGSNENNHIEESVDNDISGDKIIDKQNVVSENSQIQILNFMQDGTFWATEIDELGEQYIIHTDIQGNIIVKALYNEFGDEIECGIDNNRIVVESNGYHIFDIETLEDVSDKYIGDYDEIDDVIKTENEVIFSIKRTMESFEEEYECFKLVSDTEDILFEVSLDTETLLNEYGIEKNDKASSPYIGYCSNNVYYIPYIGYEYGGNDTLNSLIIDLNKKKVISAPFPQRNGLYISSDGDYTLIYSPQHGGLVVNNETSEFINMNFINIGYYPDGDGKLSEHKFLATSAHDGKAILDVQGNIVIDLNNYGRNVSSRYSVSLFADDTAFIRFDGDYVSFINNKGEILFDPIKGHVYDYYNEQGIAIMTDMDSGEMFSIDKNGKKEIIELPGKGEIFYVKYKGKNYWVEGGQGIHTAEIK